MWTSKWKEEKNPDFPQIFIMFLLFAHLMVGTDSLLTPNTASLCFLQQEMATESVFFFFSPFCPSVLLSMSLAAPGSTCSENGSMGDGFELAFS